MNLCVPDTLTVNSSEKYTVSIRLWPGGLSFAGHIPEEKDSFFYTETTIDLAKPYIAAIKELFFVHPFLTYSYRHTYVIYANRQYTLVPEDVFVEKEQKELMAFVFSSPDEKTLHERLEESGCEMLYSIPSDVHDFFSRSLLRPTFTHAIVPLLIQWRKQSVINYPKQLYVALHEDTMDAVCFDRDTMLFINSFQFDSANDILYYLLYIWKQIGLDQQKDQLILFANSRVYETLKETLQTYVLQVEYMQPQLSERGLEVPADITALFQCES